MLPSKKYFISFFCIISAYHAQAQDKVVMLDGDVIEGRVTEVTEETIKVKLADNPQGPEYVYETRKIRYICYENGNKEIYHGLNLEKNFELRITGAWDYSAYSRTWQEGYIGGITTYHYSYRENYYSAIITLGQRFTHYAYGAGTAVFLSDFTENTSSYSSWFNSSHYRNEKSIDLAPYVTNRFLISEGKYCPFLLLDFDLRFSNVIAIKQVEHRLSGQMSMESVVGAGVEIKTKKKCAFDIQTGIKITSNDQTSYQRALFHLGVGLIY